MKEKSQTDLELFTSEVFIFFSIAFFIETYELWLINQYRGKRWRHRVLTSSETHLQFSIYMEELIKGIVHFEIKIWYLSVYPKGIQDVGVFFDLMFLGQTVLVCQSYNGRYRSLSL